MIGSERFSSSLSFADGTFGGRQVPLAFKQTTISEESRDEQEVIAAAMSILSRGHEARQNNRAGRTSRRDSRLLLRGLQAP
jgi:hypothetical protein